MSNDLIKNNKIYGRRGYKYDSFFITCICYHWSKMKNIYIAIINLQVYKLK